jgi:NadR type nicotinamide-nucleotide adenylyltransferase
MADRGLVIGKFYPPHRGHHYLIRSARAAVAELTVIVCDLPGQVPSAQMRADWLREVHPDVRVLVVDDCVDDDDSLGWAEYTRRCLGYAPDAVFSSEDYGERFAHYLGARHVMVDRERTCVPMSGTQVRADPLACWDFLEPPVRAYYARRVCLVGAESTGKTTLAEALAAHYGTVWVPEFGRELSERKLAVDGACHWRSDEFVVIAETQCRIEDEAARKANRVLICDTDAFTTGIWHRRYLGARSPQVEALAEAHRRPDLYLLTDVETPFVQDGTRDGESIRRWMHETLLAELNAQGRGYVEVAGTPAERLRAAIAAIDPLLRLENPDE